ncbi:hypothetical protein NA57DRAFT_60552 [Rhizodiscina lignyota]|uniref:BTB domain-containing protein n=1 Tax=Rhizodiscina lignyota TaxID=1504668 RepID=A0A9P4I616_9PEZI|nr:hypothetical protein NA57DRAFT_60552 [Rhizodiscina lignyota]
MPNRTQKDKPGAMTRDVMDGGIRKRAKEAPSLGQNIIGVLVGENEQKFFVHEALLKKSSVYLRNALKECWKLASGFDTDVIWIRTVEPRTFEIYIKWLYFGKIFSIEDDDAEDHGGGTHGIHEFPRLCDLYIFGDYIQDVSLKNAAIDALIAATVERNRYPTALAARTCCNTPPTSKLYQLLVDFYAWTTTPGWIDEKNAEEDPSCDVADAPPKFWRDVLRATWKAGGAVFKDNKTYPWAKDKCKYHEHSDAEGKCV